MNEQEKKTYLEQYHHEKEKKGTLLSRYHL
jgi:hypothetical protein